jgi:epoxyqueuosine reductase
MQKTIEKILNEQLPSDNFEYGFADMTGLLDPEYKGFNYGISIARKLDDKIIDELSEGPTLKYYNHYCEVNKELNEKVKIISSLLTQNKIHSLGIESTKEDTELDNDYFKTLRLNFSHKMVATQSGLGWIGKTDLFVSKKYGPRLRLASILIDIPISAKSKPINKSLCGSCNICVDACPGKASNGRLWDINIEREEFYDPFKCREACLKLSNKKINKNISLCGICVFICPKGRKK